MDFKALMTKLETIEKKQVLTESEDRKPAKKSEREVELPSGAKVKATKVQGWQSQKADKEADKEKKKHDLDETNFTSAIAKALVEEFGYDLDEADAAPAANPWEGKDPAKAAAWAALSPEDQKWLGMADPTDEIILSRAPNKGKQPAAATRGIGAATKPAPAGPTGTQVQTDDEGNHMITTPDGKTMVVGPDGKPLPDGGKVAQGAAAPAGGAATKPAAGGEQTIDPAKVAKFKALLDKLQKSQGAAAPATESVNKVADDQILAVIKSLK